MRAAVLHEYGSVPQYAEFGEPIPSLSVVRGWAGHRHRHLGRIESAHDRGTR